MGSLKLLTPLKNKKLQFKNRVFMAPMTRSRAPQQIANDMMAEYYAQRASAGLIITEGTQISAQGVGFIFTPGIYSEEQINGWKKVTSAVHAKGGIIFAQLWHVGRASHPDFHNGQLPVAPSAVAFKAQAFTPQGFKDTVIPRALEINEIKDIVQDFKKAAQAAKAAGFDGVEIHGANGYIIAQFLEDGSNQRTDIYGGSVENRARFLLEVTEAVMEVWDAEQISVRLSPRNPYNDMKDSDPEKLYLYVVEQLNKRKLGILHLMEMANLPEGVKPLAPLIRERFNGLLIINLGYTKETAELVLEKGIADAVAFGSQFISNPDLPKRFATGAPLAKPDPSTFYGGNEKGYTDYPLIKS